MTIKLSKRIDHKLSRLAKIRGVKKTVLIKKIIWEFAERQIESPPPTRWENMKKYAGCIGSGKGDLAINHSKYIGEGLKAKRQAGAL